MPLIRYGRFSKKSVSGIDAIIFAIKLVAINAKASHRYGPYLASYDTDNILDTRTVSQDTIVYIFHGYPPLYLRFIFTNILYLKTNSR